MSKRKKVAVREATGAFVESLEPRLLLSTVMTTVGNTLLIKSTDAVPNNLTLSQNASGAIVVGGVTVNNAKTLVTGVGAGKISNITILLGVADDMVTILGPITSINTFNANLGSGNNQLVNQGNVDASGSVTINGTAATKAASVAMNLTTTTLVTAASVTTTTDTFTTPAVGATTTVSLLGLGALAANGSITIPHFFGATAVGGITLSSNPANGSTVIITDGFAGHAAITFTIAVAGGNVDATHWNVTRGLTTAATLGDLLLRINAATAATFTITAAVASPGATLSITNTTNGNLGNQVIAVAGAGITSTAMVGGADPVTVGNTVTITDANGHTIVYSAIADHGAGPAANTVNDATHHEFNIDLTNVGNESAHSLDNAPGAGDWNTGLRQAIAVDVGAARLQLAVGNPTAVVTPGADPTSYITLTDLTAGKLGNSPITFSNAQAWASPTGGMADGTDAFAAGETIQITDGGLLNTAGTAHTPVTFTSVAPAGTITDPTTQFKFVAGNAPGTLDNLAAAIGFAEAAHKIFMTNGGAAVVFNVTGATLTLVVDSVTALSVVPANDGNPLNAGLMAAVNAQSPVVNNTSGQWSEKVSLDDLGTKTGGVQPFAGGTNSQTVTLGALVTINTKIFEAVNPGGAVVGVGNIPFNDTWTGTTPATLFSPAQSLTAAINANFTGVIGASANGNGYGPMVTLSSLTTGPGGITVNTSSDPTVVAGAIVPGTTVLTVTTQNANIAAGDRLIIGDTVFLASNTNSGTIFAIGATTIDTANNLVTAINTFSAANPALFNVTATASTIPTNIFPAGLTTVNTTITITAKTAGAAGNITGSGTGPFAAFTGLTGGTDAANLVNGDSVTISDGTTTKTLTATTGTPVAGVSFAIGATPALTAANLVAAINAAFTTAGPPVVQTIVATDQGDLTGTGLVLSDTITVTNNKSAGIAGNQVIVLTNISGNLAMTNMGNGSLGGFTANKDFTATVTGNGDNVIDLMSLVVKGNLLIQANTGTGSGTGSGFNGSGTGLGGLDLTLDGVTVTGQTKVNTGAGVSKVAIDDSMATAASDFKGVFLLNMGASADTLLIDQAALATTFEKSATFYTGGGADALQDASQVVYKKATGNKFAFIGVAGQHALFNDVGTSLVTASATVIKPTATNVAG